MPSIPPRRHDDKGCSHQRESMPLAERLKRATPRPSGVPYADEVIASSTAQYPDRGVLYFLASHADPADDEVEMGQQTLSLALDLNPRTLSRIMRRLRKLGELTQMRRGHGHIKSRYRITVPRDPPTTTRS